MGQSKRVNLTKSEVEDLAPAESIYMVSDLGARGLYLQVTPAGAKSWRPFTRSWMRSSDTGLSPGRAP